MKKYFYLFVAAIAAITFVSCEGNNPSNGDKKSNATFNITVSDITATGATINVQPSNDTIKYFWSVLTKEDFTDYYAGDIDSVAAYYLSYYADEFEEYVDYYGQETMESYGMGDVASYLEYYGLVVEGEDEYTYEDLNAETEYVIFAFAYDAANNAVNSAVATKEFTTGAVSNIELGFSIETNDTALFVVPSDESATWFCAMYDKDSLDDWGYASAQEYFDDYIDYYGQYVDYGYSWSYFLYTGSVYCLLSEFEEGHTYGFACAGVVSGIQNSDLVVLEYPEATATAAEAPAKVVKAAKAVKAVKNVKMLAPAEKKLKFQPRKGSVILK